MSSFTRFNNNMLVSYDSAASIKLKKNYWRIHKGFRYYIGHVDSDEWVDVKAGKLTDGATVPFPFNSLIPAWGSYGQAVALHDQLCDTYKITRLINGVEHQVSVNRKEIDDILFEALAVLKVETWRTNLIIAGVTGYRLVTNPTEPKINKRKFKLEEEWTPLPW